VSQRGTTTGKNVLEYGGTRTLHAARGTKNVDFFCLSVCLFASSSVTLLNGKVCENDFAQKASEPELSMGWVGLDPL